MDRLSLLPGDQLQQRGKSSPATEGSRRRAPTGEQSRSGGDALCQDPHGAEELADFPPKQKQRLVRGESPEGEPGILDLEEHPG